MYAVNNSDTYDDSTVSPNEVLHIIYGLDINKTNGPDGISAYYPLLGRCYVYFIIINQLPTQEGAKVTISTVVRVNN